MPASGVLFPLDANATVLSHSNAGDSPKRLTLPRFFLYLSCSIVIGIAVMLATDAYDRHERGQTAQLSAASWDLIFLRDALVKYRDETGSLPAADEGWSVLIKGDAAPGSGYLHRTPFDPWGHIYRYRGSSNRSGVVVSSDGPDGIPRTPDDIVLDSGAP